MNGDHIDSGPCNSCGEPALPGPDQGLDHCLGLLPGVAQACCGHGNVGEAYVVIGGGPGQDCDRIENGVTLRGQQALDFFALVAGAEERWDREQPWATLPVHDQDVIVIRPYGQAFIVGDDGRAGDEDAPAKSKRQRKPAAKSARSAKAAS